jgi:hypothetical protein
MGWSKYFITDSGHAFSDSGAQGLVHSVKTYRCETEFPNWLKTTKKKDFNQSENVTLFYV